MIEFDKWNTKQPRELPSLEERKHSSSLIDAVRKQGWIGALKWALLTSSWEIVAKEIKEELYKTDATS